MKLLSSFFLAEKSYLILGLLILVLLNGCAGSSTPASAVASGSGSDRAASGYYRVQRGDNLYRIGLKFGLNVNTLMKWNNLSNADAIEAGQLLRVKNTSAAVTPPAKQSVQTPSRPKSQTAAGSTVTAKTAAPDVRLAWPVQGNIVARFNGQTQKGIDIAGSRGTPVKAAAAGTVQYAGDELRSYGRLILIKHSASTMTAYAYNDRLLVRNGQRVSAGQQIATMGDDGGAGGVRLHFEVRVNSQAVDPLRYLPN